MPEHRSAIVMGAGIVGLATARALAISGYAVTVFERHPAAIGASVRNFGMILPLGQPFGPLYERALRSKATWKQICDEAGIWYDPCGSMIAAYHQDEMDVLREFSDREHNLRPIKLLNKEKAVLSSPAINPSGLLGALSSQSEVIIDPRQAIAAIPSYLHNKYGVTFHFHKAITRIEYPRVYAGAEIYEADQIFVCSGADFETLYPEVFAQNAVTKCKLQMMRTVAQPESWRAGPSLFGGLTLPHYDSFKNCASLSVLKERYASEMPEYIKWGIHVLISQTEAAEVTIGDSHEYGLDPDPFDRAHINDLIMDYLKKFVVLRDYTISETWHGVYPKINGKTELIAQPESGVTIINALGGGGMTLSFGLAEEMVSRL